MAVISTVQKDTSKLRFDERGIELRHLRRTSVYVHDVDNVISDMTFSLYLLMNGPRRLVLRLFYLCVFNLNVFK